MIGRDELKGASSPTVIFFFLGEDTCPAPATWRKRSGTSYEAALPQPQAWKQT